jgi:hypothetical protein
MERSRLLIVLVAAGRPLKAAAEAADDEASLFPCRYRHGRAAPAGAVAPAWCPLPRARCGRAAATIRARLVHSLAENVDAAPHPLPHVHTEGTLPNDPSARRASSPSAAGRSCSRTRSPGAPARAMLSQGSAALSRRLGADLSARFQPHRRDQPRCAERELTPLGPASIAARFTRAKPPPGRAPSRNRRDEAADRLLLQVKHMGIGWRGGR